MISSRLRDASRSVNRVNVQTGTISSFHPLQEQVLQIRLARLQLQQVDPVRHQEARDLGRIFRAGQRQYHALAAGGPHRVTYWPPAGQRMEHLIWDAASPDLELVAERQQVVQLALLDNAPMVDN